MRHPVIVNADDLGLSREINKGVFTGLSRGVISDVSLLIDAPFASEAVEGLLETGRMDVGIHVNLDEHLGWSSPGRERFTRKELNDFFRDPRFLHRCRDEARLQIEKCMACGLVPTHIDTHHHVHGFFPLFMVLIDLVKEYRIPAVRHSRTGYALTTREPIPYDPSTYRRMEEIMEHEGVFFCSSMIEGAGRIGEVAYFPAELVVHPSSGRDQWRTGEMETLTSDGFLQAFHARGIRLVAYRDLIDRTADLSDLPK